MNQTYKSLPIIDIQPFINGSARRNVADQVIEACKEIGFLIIKGHEIEETVINDAFNASKSFFDLPQNIKNKWHPNEPSLQRGYHAFATRGLSYTLGEETPPDLRETFLWGRSTIIQDTFKTLLVPRRLTLPTFYQVMKLI